MKWKVNSNSLQNSRGEFLSPLVTLRLCGHTQFLWNNRSGLFWKKLKTSWVIFFVVAARVCANFVSNWREDNLNAEQRRRESTPFSAEIAASEQAAPTNMAPQSLQRGFFAENVITAPVRQIKASFSDFHEKTKTKKGFTAAPPCGSCAAYKYPVVSNGWMVLYTTHKMSTSTTVASEVLPPAGTNTFI